MGTYCIVADERRRRSEMDNRRGFRATASERVNMRHDVVSAAAFFRFGDVEIDVREIPFHFIELLIGDVQAQLLAKGERTLASESPSPSPVGYLLTFGQPEPKSSPAGELLQVAEVVAHLRRGVARDQGRAVLGAKIGRAHV